MKAADLFLRCLETEGVRTIYGVPGEENADVMIALLDSPIEFVVCRHEQAAAFMADMHGRLTGEPGVCLATLGPGATNLVTGVASANMDHAPLVAIVGQASTRRLHKQSHQNMDAVRMFQPVTKWASTVRDADNIPEIVHKAFRLARGEKPGATVIELPEDIAKAESSEEPIQVKVRRSRTGVESGRVAEVMQLIAEAEFPLLLLGDGCVRARVGELVEQFVDKTGIYAASTFMGKGALPARHPRCLYCVGLGARDVVLDAFEHADLVITIGYDMVEWHPDRWNTGTTKKIVHIDTRPPEVDRRYNVDLEIIGDLAAALEALLAACGPEQSRRAESYDHHVGEMRRAMTEELHRHDRDTGFPIKPQRILSDLRAVLDDEDILISDVGAHKMWVARHYPTQRAGTCFITNGFCSMGFALPAAISAKRLLPERKVVALCGDGGFLMNVQDLITAVRYRIPITVLLWVDGQYGLIKWKQEAAYGRHSHIDLVNPDFTKLVESFGCQALPVASAEALIPALEQAFATPDRPSVVVVPVDYDENLKLTRRLGEIISH
ncbi:MAG: acetolactate synthase large subunit [Deferrisomatales bacterium]|nr:acetolactate synthase large subunit [Deferrisomatales bacterium]